MSVPTAAVPVSSRSFISGFAALIIGALAMGASPIFVRFSEVGPFATAFWRVALALPVLAIWAAVEEGDPRRALARLWEALRDLSVLASGVLFVGDLMCWHISVLNTLVANATLLATLTPVWVLLGSNLVLREPVHPRDLVGLGICLIGALALVGSSYRFNPGRLYGDFFGLATSLFFGLYLLAIRRARRTVRPGMLLFVTSLITAVVLYFVARDSEPRLVPVELSLAAIWPLAALALVCHAGGQGMLAVGLGLLPAGFSSLVIFLEAVAAAGLAWVVLGEPLGLEQIAGGALILAGIAFARPK